MTPEEIARAAHAGQKRHDHSDYFTNHVAIVAERARRRHNRIAQDVAFLHDVVEDGADIGWTLERLRAEGISSLVIEAVEAMTRREGERYVEYIHRVKRNFLARAVKRIDLEHNASTCSGHQRDKYELAMEILLS